MERKTGENFDENVAKDIFDRLRTVEGKTKPKGESKLKPISDMMSEAKYLEGKGKLDEAIVLYKQVIFTLPDSTKAYESLINIYQKRGDVDSEKEMLIKAISGCKDNESFKKRLDEINNG